MAPISATAKVTSKGQITIPLALRRALGIRTGDRLRFESDHNTVQVRIERQPEDAFARYQGIGNPGIGSGRRAILSYMRRLRRG